MEERIEQLEQEVKDLKEIVLLLCERVDDAELHISNAYKIYQNALKHPMAKMVLHK